MRIQRYQNTAYAPPHSSARARDHQLARMALCGDTEAWNILYQSAIRWVPGAVEKADLQHFFSAWDYRDIADEALSRCYGHLERYRGLSRFRWWVLGYAKNILRNRIQRQLTHRRNQYLLERAVDHRALCQDPLEVLLRLERDQFLWEAFCQLSPVDQFIVYQRIFFQTTYATLAKHAQLTRNQVRQRYQDALNAIRWNFLRCYRAKRAGRLIQ